MYLYSTQRDCENNIILIRWRTSAKADVSRTTSQCQGQGSASSTSSLSTLAERYANGESNSIDECSI